jgi:hypothetical protein
VGGREGEGLEGKGEVETEEERRGVVTEMGGGGGHRVHLGEEEKWGECTCPLSWCIQHNFPRDGR